jgi:transglutaminase-like putative cysteine protease
MIYEISHRTAYRYEFEVTQSQHLAHLAPRRVSRQKVIRHNLVVEPAPSWRNDFTDYLGNPASILGIDEEHRELVLHARSTIDVKPRATVDLVHGCPWEQVLTRLTSGNAEIDLDVVQYAMPSPATMPVREAIAYGAPSFTPGRPVIAAAWDLTCRIFADFAFDSQATDVTTPVSEVLAKRRGVCQDFAHLALTCLRARRVPARYVSGYLLTRPPEGKEKLQGADASHAWISVWTPEAGWVDLDPTNKVVVSDEHITFAYGREYGDVSPVSGVLLGGGTHAVAVAVDVDVLDPA